MPTLTPAITLTATLQDLTGVNTGSTAEPARVLITLCNFDPVLPRIVGTSMLAKTVYDVVTQDGSMSIPIWGNDVITPQGTYYSVAILDGDGNTIQCSNYQLSGSGTQDLSNLPPFVPPPPTISVTAFADDVVPAGTIDGTNAVFTLPQAPNPPASLNDFYNGVRLTEGIGYLLSGSTITYQAGYVPQPGDTHITNYRFIQQQSSPGQTVKFADDIVPAGTIDGTNAVFTLPQAPNPQDSLDLFLNGIRLTDGIGYTLSGAQITYEPTYIPQPGDTHISNYRYF
jgi:hypothetical protein